MRKNRNRKNIAFNDSKIIYRNDVYHNDVYERECIDKSRTFTKRNCMHQKNNIYILCD